MDWLEMSLRSRTEAMLYRQDRNGTGGDSIAGKARNRSAVEETRYQRHDRDGSGSSGLPAGG